MNKPNDNQTRERKKNDNIEMKLNEYKFIHFGKSKQCK